MNRNAADEEQVKEAGRREKDLRKQELLDFKAIMETPCGRRFMGRMLDICGFQRTSMTGNNTTFYNEGQRSIALQLWADMNEACPELYLTMLKELKKGDTND